MKFEDTVKAFLSEQPDVYTSRIKAFEKFLLDEKGINDSSYKTYLGGMKTEEILQSLDYFIERNKIKKASVANHYISVVTTYFQYIERYGIENEHLFKELGKTNNGSFYKTVKKYILDDERLEDIVQSEPLDSEEINILIDHTDKILNNIINITKDDLPDEKDFNRMSAAIGLKLMIFCGTKYEVLMGIKKEDFSSVKRKIIINTYELHLPDNLAMQLTEYEKYRNKIKGNSELLFVRYDGEELQKETWQIAQIIKKIDRTDTLGIIKYAVIQMIRSGINQNFIMNLTAIGTRVYDYCQNIVNQEKVTDRNRYIDSKIRSLEMFDYL